jgi:hypothetical protein
MGARNFSISDILQTGLHVKTELRSFGKIELRAIFEVHDASVVINQQT